MTTGDPDKPAPPFGAAQYPSLENSPPPPDPHAPVDYPADAGLPPPIYPPPIYPPPPPGYYPAYDPYQPTKLPGTNGKAVASLVTSVASIVLCCGIPAFVGVIVGVMAMRETRRTGQDGYGMALAGTIIGSVATAGLLLYILFYVALMASGWQWI